MKEGAAFLFYDSHIEYITGKKIDWKNASDYFRLSKSTSGKWMGFFLLLNHAFTPKHHYVCVCMWFTRLLYCHTLLYVRGCKHPLPFVGNAEPLYFRGSHFSSIFYSSLSLSLSPYLSLSLSSILGDQNKVLSMLHHTPLRDWLAGWNPIGTIWVASVAIEKLPPPDGCKQSFCYFSPLFTHCRLTVWVQHMLTLFSAFHRGAVQNNQSSLTQGHLKNSLQQQKIKGRSVNDSDWIWFCPTLILGTSNHFLPCCVNSGCPINTNDTVQTQGDGRVKRAKTPCRDTSSACTPPYRWAGAGATNVVAHI